MNISVSFQEQSEQKTSFRTDKPNCTEVEEIAIITSEDKFRSYNTHGGQHIQCHPVLRSMHILQIRHQ